MTIVDLRKAQRAEAARLIAARRRRPHPEAPLQGAEPDPALEEWADGILEEDRRRDYEENGRHFVNDILFYDQLKMRQEREVLAGLRLDPSFYSGLYHRAYNPMMGRRPKSYPHHASSHGEPEWDSRVSSRGGAGWTDLWVTRDPGAVNDKLTRGQRRRIRAAMRQVPAEQKRLARITLAMMFEVSPATIYRVCLNAD